MCSVSDKIKLCTCNTDEIDLSKTDNYWILRKRAGDQKNVIIGIMHPDWDIIKNNSAEVGDKILNQLNAKDIFDTKNRSKRKATVHVAGKKV